MRFVVSLGNVVSGPCYKLLQFSRAVPREAERASVSSQHSTVAGSAGQDCLSGCFSFLPSCLSSSDMHTLPNSVKSPAKFTGTRP